jgi:acetylornithine deacetylase/succinyl-diaminopimelate desuccinylase-like protein
VDGTQNKVGTNLTEFLKVHAEELKSDFCFCSTGSGVGEKPTIEIGQRGGLNFDLVLSATQGPLNTTLEMSKLLTKFYNLNKIAIPYFYYNVENAKPEAEIRRYGTNLEYKTITRSTKSNHAILDPSLEITGIISLPKFEKSQVAPKKTIANLQMHLVPHQNFQEIINGLHQRLKMVVSPHLKTELVIHEAFNPCKFDIKNSYTQKAIALLAGAFKTPIEYSQKES